MSAAAPTPSMSPSALHMSMEPAYPPRSFPPARVAEGELYPFPTGRVILYSSATGYGYDLRRVLRECIYGCVYFAVRVHGWVPGDGEPPVGEDTAEDSRNANCFAVKVISKEKVEAASSSGKPLYENPYSEMRAMNYVSSDGGHPNVINQAECLQNSRYVFSVMDYIGPGGELFDFIKTGKAQAEGEPYVRELMIQLLQGMQYLHDRYVFHRDISCENVLLCPPISSGMLPVGGGAGAARSLAAAGAGPTAVPRVVIIDLGMCLLMPDAGKCVPSGACGKINYCAEEILANKAPFDGRAADMWGVGVIFFTLLFGSVPVESASPFDKRYQLIQRGLLPQMMAAWKFTASPAATDLVCKLLTADPSKRLSAHQALQHPWCLGQTEL